MKATSKQTLPMRIRLSSGKTADIRITTETVVQGRITSERKLTDEERAEVQAVMRSHLESMAGANFVLEGG